MGFVGPLPLATLMSNVRKDGPCVTSATTPSLKALRVVIYDVTPSLRGFLDQGVPLPPLPQIPRVVSSSRTPESLPSLVDWESDRFLGDIDSDDESPPEPFFKSSEARHWIEQQEQQAVTLRVASVRPQGSFPASSDAGEEPPSLTGGGEWGYSPGDGNQEVGVGPGAGHVGSQCAGMLGLCVPPSDDEVELLLFFALSS